MYNNLIEWIPSMLDLDYIDHGIEEGIILISWRRDVMVYCVLIKYEYFVTFKFDLIE
ncbi:MAG: hypothetical protein JXA91_05730 [Candidatus Thermoplasmatota archaeon]|nr:hypothetical protein [Candidatus Thermoplasmatota archaeon]